MEVQQDYLQHMVDYPDEDQQKLATVSIERMWPVYIGTGCKMDMLIKNDGSFIYNYVIYADDSDEEEEEEQVMASITVKGRWTRDRVILRLEVESAEETGKLESLNMIRKQCFEQGPLYARIGAEHQILMKIGEMNIIFGWRFQA